MKTILLIAAWISLSLPLFSQGSNTMGKPVNANLVDYRLKTSAQVTITGVYVSTNIDFVNVAVYINYKNTGKTPFTWEFGMVALVDAQGRQFTGLAATNERSMRKFRDFIRELQPGLTINNHVYFKLPKSAFDGNINFCFLNEANNKPQCPIRIYDKKKSTYDFKKSASFKTSVWE